MWLNYGKGVSRNDIPLHCEMTGLVRSHARAVLRRELKENHDWASSDMAADVIVEQIWNALVGLDNPETE